MLSYDADAAGQKAALRGIELLKAAGISARVLHISDGKDPDEFITKNGRQAFQALVDQALPSRGKNMIYLPLREVSDF